MVGFDVAMQGALNVDETCRIRVAKHISVAALIITILKKARVLKPRHMGIAAMKSCYTDRPSDVRLEHLFRNAKN